LKRFNDHNEAVRTYFKERPDDLLVIDMFNGDGWVELCNFLGIEKPPVNAFPHTNRAGVREVYEAFRINKVKKGLRKVFG
jgi:hypothetical protein